VARKDGGAKKEKRSLATFLRHASPLFFHAVPQVIPRLEGAISQED